MVLFIFFKTKILARLLGLVSSCVELKTLAPQRLWRPNNPKRSNTDHGLMLR
jgi:hypothetical protein